MKIKLLTRINNWRRNKLFVTAAEARRACTATFEAGQQDARFNFSKAVMSLTDYKVRKGSSHRYDLHMRLDAAVLETKAGAVAGAVIIAEEIAHRILAFHQARKSVKK